MAVAPVWDSSVGGRIAPGQVGLWRATRCSPHGGSQHVPHAFQGTSACGKEAPGSVLLSKPVSVPTLTPTCKALGLNCLAVNTSPSVPG